MRFNLARDVWQHARDAQHRGRPALVADGGSVFSYAELAARAGRLAAQLARLTAAVGSTRPRVGVIASRSHHACIAVLGCAWAGVTYVPIGLKTPSERLKHIFAQAELSAIVCDAAGRELLEATDLPQLPELLCVPQPSASLLTAAEALVSRVLDLDALPDTPAPPLAATSPGDLAYIMFTSGTTGVPKGVMISAQSACAFLDMIAARLRLTPEDRTLEVTELGFDVSVLDMFATWRAGGSLHVLPATKVMNAVRFARERRISVWSSTPSLVSLLRRVKVLQPGALPDVRLAIFIGEPLSQGTLEGWREAAPASVVEDLYGPTEATVVCTGQRVDSSHVLTPGRDVLSIGTELPGTDVAILDSQQRPLPIGEIGEIALSGVQLAQGYLGAPELSARKFPVLGGKRFYLTGDSGYRDALGRLHHLGRLDHQVKILGNRVELEEIEAHLRELARVELVAVIPWPTLDGAHQGLVAFACGASPAAAPHIVRELKRRVPPYMVPAQLHWLPEMPMNSNGKIDRHALRARLEDSSG